MANVVVISLILAAVQVLGAIILSVGALFSGLKMLDRMTVGIEEWKEIRKGNTAVGIFYATAVVCIMLMILPQIEETLKLIQASLPWQTTIVLLALAIVNYLFALGLSIFVIFISINLFDKLTIDIDEIGSLRKGNLAIALLMSMVLLAVTFAVRYPMDYLFLILKVIETSVVGL